jgi:hypothetical protein
MAELGVLVALGEGERLPIVIISVASLLLFMYSSYKLILYWKTFEYTLANISVLLIHLLITMIFFSNF